MTLDYVKYELSYANLIMYSSVLPSYNADKNKKDEVISGDDPANMERIKQLTGN